MNTPSRHAAAGLLAVTLAACSSLPADHPGLNQARNDYRSVQGDATTQRLAALELKQAGDALAMAEAAHLRRDDKPQIDQLAYLARQRAALAHEAALRKAAEETVAQASAERDRLRLAARTQEADAATRTARSADRDAASAQQQAQASQQQAGEAERRSAALEAQLRELQATQTDRGMVVTIGDVLFDSGRAQLKAGAVHNLEGLGRFLMDDPQRKALIEGYTDNTGSEATNQALSVRRADAVLAALVDLGVARSQLKAEGFGESRPVAGNESAAGRQRNRRVEVVLSDDARAAAAPARRP